MAALFFVLCATILSIVLAQDTYMDPTEAGKKICSEFNESDPCHNYCVQQALGIIDKDGRYVESGAAVIVAFDSKGTLNPEQVNKIAKNCNSLNEQQAMLAAPGCKRAYQVDRCLVEEKFKITDESD